jgi:DNA replication and repair protein RecF
VWVREVWLKDFRNYEEAEVSLDSGVNLILGRNGQGKTSLLEAIYCLSALGSHRTNTAGVMVRHEAAKANIHATGFRGSREVRMDAEIARGSGLRVLVNKQPLGRRQRPMGVVSVMFSPEDLVIVKGGPEERRRFIDAAAAASRPVTAADRAAFDRALRQRNAVLKAARQSPAARRQLEVWNEQVAGTGAVVVVNRKKVLGDLEPAIRSRYCELSSGEPPELAYETSWGDCPPEASVPEVAEILRVALCAAEPSDLERAVTTVGPHRDDLSILLAGADARQFASQGEQRSLALAFRLAERDLLTDLLGEEPVLLLDDVFSELDERRREQLAKLMQTSGQTLATSTSRESLPLAGGRTVVVDEGRLIQVG